MSQNWAETAVFRHLDVLTAVAARGVGAALLGAFGGPVGIAITGITVALVGLASETAKTRAALDGVEAITSDAARALNDAKGKADSAATGVRGVGSEAAASETKVRSFAGAVGEAAQELYNLARARQATLISDLEAKRQEASVQYSELWGQTRRGLDARVRGDGSIRHQIFSLDGWKADLTRLGRSIGMLEDPEAELQEGMADLKTAMADYDAAIAEASRNLERFATNPRTPAPAGTKPTGRTRTGKTDAERAAEAEKRLQERIQQATDDLRLQLRLADLRAEGLDVQADKEQAVANIRQQFPELVNTENAALREQLALMEGLAIAAVDKAEAQRQAQEQKDRQETYSGIIGDGQNFVRDQGNELQAMGMDPETASAALLGYLGASLAGCWALPRAAISEAQERPPVTASPSSPATGNISSTPRPPGSICPCWRRSTAGRPRRSPRADASARACPTPMLPAST